MWSYAFPLAILIVWLVVYFAYLRPKLIAYRYTAGIMAQFQRGERSAWAWIKLQLRGAKSVILSFVVSGAAAVKATTASTVATVNGVSASDLTQFKDASLWQTFFTDGTVLKIISGLSILIAVLTVKGHLTAAKATPQADPTSGGAR